MSTIVPMPVRVKPPPAEIGDTISPSCAALTVTTPANGARTTVSSRLRSANATAERATSSARFATSSPVRAASYAALAVSNVCALITAFASCCSLRLNVGTALSNATCAAVRFASACACARARLLERRARVRVVEPSDDLVARDSPALFDGDLHDLARDLRRHRGLTARDDVARRVEDRGRPDGDVGRRRLGGRDADRRRVRQRIPRDPAGDRDTGDDPQRPHDPASAALFFGGRTIDT